MAAHFIHLRLHSEYSLIDSIIEISALCEKIAQTKMPAVSITDHSNLFATVKFFQAATSLGIKPIIGADLAIINENNANQPFLLTLLCQNNAGFQSLIQLISRAYLEGQKNYPFQPQIERSWLQDNTENLIALSGERFGDIGQALLQGNEQAANHYAQQWAKLFPNRYYIEVQRNGRMQQEQYLAAALDCAQRQGLPIVATNDVRFIHKQDFDAHEARVCIQQGCTMNDPARPKIYNQEQYLKTENEMCALFQDLPESLQNTVEIAKRCNLEVALGNIYLPKFSTPNQCTPEEHCTELALIGLEKRLAQFTFDAQQIQTYQQRLQTELTVINRMGYASYFLIVADFIAWAKKQGIPVGPGRGSGAGSLVAYALQITDLDPLQYDLLFERFLNPERVSLPDFDIDFCMVGRDRVIEYVTNKYGRECVAQIITFGTMAAKAVVRDVGRVLGYPYGFVDKIAKLIPFELGITLAKALQQEELLRERYEQEEEVTELIDLAKKLEGIVRNAGKHAGGVVIAPTALTDFTPLYCEAGAENITVTQFDKDDVESVGLIKFDFLGLRTLTIIDWAIKMINDRIRQKQSDEPLVDCLQIPLDDTKTYELIKRCETTAVFQIESRGMKELIKRLQPDCFEDIIALVALYRPGPLQSGMVEDFIDRKHGRAQVIYPHEALAGILRPTYGVILYQEQVMQIAQVLAGYTLGEADLLRRAMGKKKPEEMAKQRQIFITGAKLKNVDGETANTIFDLMEKFAGYGFNKSHSAAYALISYQTAWLKAHYKAEYLAAVLSSDLDHTDKVVFFIEECKRLKMNILPPDVNHSAYLFTVADDHTIRFGLGAIKGVGESAIDEIVNARKRIGPFKHLLQFCLFVDLRKVNRRVCDALIRSGACDSFGESRANLLASLGLAMQQAEQIKLRQTQKQTDLFTSTDPLNYDYSQFNYQQAKLLTEIERLQGEKATLGFYLTGHPLDRFQSEFTSINIVPINELQQTQTQTARIAGILLSQRNIVTKSGNKMAVITVEDRSSRMDITLFSDLFREMQLKLQKDQIYIIEGEVNLDEFTQSLRMIGRRIYPINEMREKYAQQLLLKLSANLFEKTQISDIANILTNYRGGMTQVRLIYQTEESAVLLNADSNWSVQLTSELLLQLEQIFNQDNIEIIYQNIS